MASKNGDYASKAINALAGAAAAYVARKGIMFIWTKAMGRKPPGKAEDPEVALGEALAWTVVAGVAVSVARLLAVRLAGQRIAKQLSDSTE